jgi:hypothetical protein
MMNERSTKEGINLWTSKRSFLRALLGCVDRRGFGLIPVGEVSGKESSTALWLKIMSPRHMWTWRYAADGRPIFCPPGADDQGKAGIDFFTSMEAVCSSDSTCRVIACSVLVGQRRLASCGVIKRSTRLRYYHLTNLKRGRDTGTRLPGRLLSRQQERQPTTHVSRPACGRSLQAFGLDCHRA